MFGSTTKLLYIRVELKISLGKKNLIILKINKVVNSIYLHHIIMLLMKSILNFYCFYMIKSLNRLNITILTKQKSTKHKNFIYKSKVLILK